MTSYSTIPKLKDKLKTYVYFKQKISRCLNFKHARNSQDTTKTLILASIDNSYIEGCAQNLNICGQTIRNHLKQQPNPIPPSKPANNPRNEKKRRTIQTPDFSSRLT